MNIEDVFKNHDGYTIRTGDMMEAILSYTISCNLMTSTVLHKQIEIEHLLRSGTVDPAAVGSDVQRITDSIAEQAIKHKNEIIARLYVKNKD